MGSSRPRIPTPPPHREATELVKKATKARKSRAPTKKELEAQLTEARGTLAETEARFEELHDRLAYLQAEVENVRKQAEKERHEVLRFASAGVLQKLLPVMDEFEIALTSMRDRDDDFANGVRMIFDNFVRTLQAEGLEEIPAEEAAFDPYLHEAVGFSESEGQEGVIVEVLAKGYRVQDRILRPSQVVVRRKGGSESG